MSSFNKKKRQSEDLCQSNTKSKQKFDKKNAKKEADKFISKGVDLQEKGDYVGARRQYEFALNSFSNYSEGLYNLASLNLEILENEPNCSRSKLAVQAVDHLNTIIASDTSKRGETTGLAHFMLANLMVDCKDVLLQNFKNNDTKYHSSIDQNFTSAISILQTSKERDEYILEFGQYLYSQLVCLFEKVHSSDTSPPELVDSLRNVLHNSQRVLEVLSSALQTSFSSGIDSEVLSLRGDVLSDTWDCLLGLFRQCLLSVETGLESSVTLNGLAAASTNNVIQLHSFLMRMPDGGDLLARLQTVACDSHKTCASLEALLSSQDRSSPGATHLIVDLTLSLMSWHRMNGNVSEFVGRCGYWAEAQSSLLGALQTQRAEHLASVPTHGASRKHCAYLVDVVSTLGDSLASLAAEMACVASCEASFAARIGDQLAAAGLVGGLQQCCVVLDTLSKDFSVGEVFGPRHEVSLCAASSLLGLSRGCYNLALEVWVTGLAATSGEVERGPRQDDAALFQEVQQSGLCNELQFSQLFRLYVCAVSSQRRGVSNDEAEAEEEEEEDSAGEIRDLLYNMACVMWRLRDEQACCEALLRCGVLDRLVRRRAGGVAVKESSLFRDISKELDLAGVEIAAWFPTLHNLLNL